jgi:DNA-directed RNA polymerase subunit RPC12/RpoP
MSGCYCTIWETPCGWCSQEFADPGGESALRAGVRDRPCPTCGEENRLTSKDVSLGYQCDVCASRLEGTYRGGDY